MKSQFYDFTNGRWARRLIGLLLLSPCFLSAQNVVVTYAGSGIAGLLEGDTLSAQFNQPSDIDRDPFGNHIVVDMSHVLWKIDLNGIVTILAGDGVAGYQDGPDSIARFNGALNACIDSVGNVYVSDFHNQRIRKIDLNGNVTTIAGSGTAGYKDTTALEAQFRYPRGICMDRQGNLYIADSWNHRIRKLDPQGNVTTFAGGGTSMGVQSPGDWIDGPDTSARFWTPCGLEIDSNGNLYLADAYNHRIRKIDPQGVVTTLAGNGAGGATSGGYLDGPASFANFDTPTGLCVASNGDVHVADTYNNCMRMVSGGNVVTSAGFTTPGYIDGWSHVALMNHPRAALMDPWGTSVYVPDGNNHVIRRVLLWWMVAVDGPLAEVNVSPYPNPAATKVLFQLPTEAAYQGVRLSIWNAAGQQVLADRPFIAGDAIDVAQWPQGLYTARLQAGGRNYVAKFLKQ